MVQLNPYLSFNNKCREALNFYQECLGGEVNFMVVRDSPVANQVPAHMQDSILHATLKTAGFEIMASDMTPETLNDGNAVHLCLIMKGKDEADKLFSRLAAGGKINQPLNEMFFGWIGTLTDKFGKRWMIECDKP